MGSDAVPAVFQEGFFIRCIVIPGIDKCFQEGDFAIPVGICIYRGTVMIRSVEGTGEIVGKDIMVSGGSTPGIFKFVGCRSYNVVRSPQIPEKPSAEARFQHGYQLISGTAHDPVDPGRQCHNIERKGGYSLDGQS